MSSSAERDMRDMREKICLVTGATSGIGAVTAQALAQQGATVVIVARHGGRAAATVARLKAQTGNPAVEYLMADLSAQEQVRDVARAFSERHPRLDVLVNNAGALFYNRRESVDGLEMTFALNYLAPFLLTHLLLGRLEASPAARVVNVASAAHEGATIPFDDLQQTHGRYRGLRTYGQSKLALILFTYELARRLENTTITVNAVHPGFVASNFGMDGPAIVRLGMPLAQKLAVSTERGAQTVIYLATAPEVEGISGRYFVKCKPVASSPASYDRAAARRLWEIGEQLTVSR
jgi:NAD(P)-dependent dehydrogenase (short-subunit alcohol dehydrogenase family)